MRSLNSFNTRKQISIDDKNYNYYDLNILASTYGFNLLKIYKTSVQIIF